MKPQIGPQSFGAVSRWIKSLPVMETVSIIAGATVGILGALHVSSPHQPEKELHRKRPSLRAQYGENKIPQASDQLILEELDYFDPFYQLINTRVIEGNKRALEEKDEAKKAGMLKDLSVMEAYLSSWRKLQVNPQKNAPEIIVLQRHMKHTLTRMDDRYSRDEITQLFEKIGHIKNDNKDSKMKAEKEKEALVAVYNFLKKTDPEIEQVIRQKLEDYLCEYGDKNLSQKLYPYSIEKPLLSLDETTEDNDRVQIHETWAKLYLSKDQKGLIQHIIQMGFSEEKAKKIIENIPESIGKIEVQPSDPKSMQETNKIQEVGSALSVYFRKIVLRNYLAGKKYKDPIEKLYWTLIDTKHDKDITDDIGRGVRENVEESIKQIEILYGIKVSTEDSLIGRKTEGLDLIRMQTMLHDLKRALSIFPNAIMEKLKTRGLYIILASKVIGAGGFASNNRIVLAYSHDIYWAYGTVYHELTHGLDFYDDRNMVNIFRAELVRENSGFDALNHMLDYYEGKGSQFIIESTPGSNGGYGLTNVDEDEASLGEAIFMPADMQRIIKHAYEEYMKGPENIYQKVLKLKIEAMTGCELDLENGIPAFKKEFTEEEYIAYFEKQLGKKVFSQMEYFGFWSRDRSGKPLMNADFWNNILAGKTPVWDGSRYIYLNM